MKRRLAVFYPEFLEDLSWWVETDSRIAVKTLDVARECLPTPFAGRGKPESLKGALAGAWSRRLTQEHRLVYVVKDDRIEFIQARHHY